MQTDFLPAQAPLVVVRRRNWKKGLQRIAFTLLFILFAGYSCYSYFFGGRRAATESRADLLASATPDTTTVAPTTSTAEIERQEKAAVGRSRLKGLLDEGASIRSACDALEKEIAGWHTEIQPLWTNDVGRMIASNPGSMLSFEAETKSARPTQEDADSLKARYVTLLTPVRAAWDSGQWSYRPSSDLDGALKDLKKEIDATLEKVQEPKSHIAMLVSAAKLMGRSADTTLQEALDQYHAKQNADWATTEAARRTKIDDDFAAARAAQAEKAEREKQQAALELERAKQELEKVKLTSATSDLNSDANHEKLLRKAKSGTTRQLLGFFMTRGYFQPNGQTTVEKHPYSYSLLQADGSLEPTMDGQTRLYGHMYDRRDRDRPLVNNGNLALYNQPAATRERVNQIQKALIELGPTLVELKMLDP